jgi:hypothetical protein
MKELMPLPGFDLTAKISADIRLIIFPSCGSRRWNRARSAIAALTLEQAPTSLRAALIRVIYSKLFAG